MEFKSMRMNKEVRAYIVEKAIGATNKFNREKQKENYEKFKKTWGMALYNAIYPRNIQQRMARMPDGAFGKRDHITVTLDQSVIPESRYHMEHIRVPLPTPLHQFHEHIEKWIDAKGLDCYASFDPYAADRKRTAMEKELIDFLKQFTTTKQVYEHWPEGRKFLPKPVSESKALIVKPDSVNELLGLSA